MTQTELNAKLEQLVKDNLGKPVEKEDPSNLDQCFDWLFAYVDALGIPRSAVRHLRAYEIWTLATDETRQYFDLISNSPTAVPIKGDIPIFDKTVGVSGHVCVADGNLDGTKTFQSTDQNWNGHLYIEYIWHNYNGCLGWLRPKVTASVPTEPMATITQAALNQIISDRDRNWNMYLNLNKIAEDQKKQIASFSLKNEVLVNIQKEINRLS